MECEKIDGPWVMECKKKIVGSWVMECEKIDGPKLMEYKKIVGPRAQKHPNSF